MNQIAMDRVQRCAGTDHPVVLRDRAERLQGELAEAEQQRPTVHTRINNITLNCWRFIAGLPGGMSWCANKKSTLMILVDRTKIIELDDQAIGCGSDRVPLQ